MAVIRISNDIELTVNELPRGLLEQIKEDLTLPNPEYTQAIRQGRSIYGKAKDIFLYRIEEDNLILPRGYGFKLLKRFKGMGVTYKVEDNRLVLPPVDFKSSINLRDYQVPAVDVLVRYRQGGVVAGCGSGKTMILLGAMTKIKQPALWVCHTYELLNQTLERACEVFGMDPHEVGIIANGKITVGDRLTLALIQTLAKADLSELSGRFGAVFVDEAHHLAARSFFHPISQFPALYRLWASATPERADGLTEMVFSAGGPVLYKVDACQLPTITPALVVVETGYTGNGDDYTKLVSGLIRDPWRNKMIVRTIADEAPGNYSLVLSDRVEHLATLQELLKKQAPGLVVEMLTGGMSKKARVKVMERVKARQVDVLLATQLAREGLDIIHLNRLYLTTPKRAAGAVQQEVGRIMRPAPGKVDAVVFDFWDSGSPILRAQFWPRREVYKKLGIDWSPARVRRFAN